jgi:hypothetical protein
MSLVARSQSRVDKSTNYQEDLGARLKTPKPLTNPFFASIAWLVYEPRREPSAALRPLILGSSPRVEKDAPLLGRVRQSVRGQMTPVRVLIAEFAQQANHECEEASHQISSAFSRDGT